MTGVKVKRPGTKATLATNIRAGRGTLSKVHNALAETPLMAVVFRGYRQLLKYYQFRELGRARTLARAMFDAERYRRGNEVSLEFSTNR